MEGLEALKNALPWLVPLMVLQTGLLLWAVIDLANRENVRGDKLVWVALIIMVGIIGPLVYFIFGRRKSKIQKSESDSGIDA
jgi:heme/copper-type cytochrome/quinol oxidase subunit 2